MSADILADKALADLDKKLAAAKTRPDKQIIQTAQRFLHLVFNDVSNDSSLPSDINLKALLPKIYVDSLGVQISWTSPDQGKSLEVLFLKATRLNFVHRTITGYEGNTERSHFYLPEGTTSLFSCLTEGRDTIFERILEQKSPQPN